jgi:hypothetical protein
MVVAAVTIKDKLNLWQSQTFGSAIHSTIDYREKPGEDSLTIWLLGGNSIAAQQATGSAKVMP